MLSTRSNTTLLYALAASDLPTGVRSQAGFALSGTKIHYNIDNQLFVQMEKFMERLRLAVSINHAMPLAHI